jgi:DNA-binding NarL/FixJ family response regulator
MKPEAVEVCLVEDDPGLCASFREILGSDPHFACTGSFASGEEALAGLPSLRPHVVLMDINLPGMSGVECVARLAGLLPDTQIIMLTIYDDTDVIFQSLSAGACGYLLKPVRRAQLIGAIRDVLRGGAPMSSSIARCVVQAFRNPAPAARCQNDEEISRLSPREREILELLAQGLLLKEIADRFNVSHPTVQTHIGRIYKKLHVHSRAQAVARLKGH